MSNQIE